MIEYLIGVRPQSGPLRHYRVGANSHEEARSTTIEVLTGTDNAPQTVMVLIQGGKSK